MRAQTLAWLAPAVLLVGSAALSSPASAQMPRLGETGSSTGARSRADRQRLLQDEQLREELKEQLKAELKAELQQEGVQPSAPKQDAWSEEEWKWEEPVKPELNFLELDGYFRFRYQLFNHLDLGTYYHDTVTRQEFGPFIPGYAPPTPLCNTDPKCVAALGKKNTLAGANMRLRLEPVLNVYEDIKIKMQWDVLDNVVLGSTPDGLVRTPLTPLVAFSKTQLTPSDTVNAIGDSIRVKRVWGEVGTPLGQLRFGRMPSHFGLGVLANEGRGLDADYGSTSDRLMFITKIGDFYIAPGFDWAATGPTSATRILSQGQPFDRDQRDDVDQYVLAIAKRDKDEEIKQKLENDELVLNYGTYQVLRYQSLDTPDYYSSNLDNGKISNQVTLTRRNARAWIASLWFKLLWRKLTVEAELASIWGKIENPTLSADFDTREPSLELFQQGGAINAEYKLLRDSLTLGLLVVFATGDHDYGWGIAPLSNPSPKAGAWDGSQGASDNKITNFRFDPGFYVDLILWRQLIGMITDALIIRPSAQYNVTEGFGLRLDLVYSRAWFAESTPSSAVGATPDNNLGLESDLKVFYDSEDGFHAWLQYGLLVPLGGLSSAAPIGGNEANILKLDAGIAHTIQAMFAISF